MSTLKGERITNYKRLWTHNIGLGLYSNEAIYMTFNPFSAGTHLNPLSPHDALKHHFTSLKTDLIFLQPRVLEGKFP